MGAFYLPARVVLSKLPRHPVTMRRMSVGACRCSRPRDDVPTCLRTAHACSSQPATAGRCRGGALYSRLTSVPPLTSLMAKQAPSHWPIDPPRDRVPLWQRRALERTGIASEPWRAYRWICRRSHCFRSTCQADRKHTPRGLPWLSRTTIHPREPEQARGERAVRSSRVSLATVCPFLVTLNRERL